MALDNVSPDLVWEIVRNQNAYLVRRKKGGFVQFSRDPHNLTNVHNRKHAGFVNDKSVGVAHNEKGGVHVTSKKIGSSNKPHSSQHKVSYGGGKPNRATYKSIASSTAKSGYRPDLRQAAVARASTIKKSQRPVKADPERKLRGNAAKKAAAKEE